MAHLPALGHERRFVRAETAAAYTQRPDPPTEGGRGRVGQDSDILPQQDAATYARGATNVPFG